MLYYLLKIYKINSKKYKCQTQIKANLNLKIWQTLKAQKDTFYKKNLLNKEDNSNKEVDNLQIIAYPEKDNQLPKI